MPHTSSRDNKIELAGLLNVIAGKVKLTIRVEKDKIMKVLGVVNDSLSAYIEFGLYKARKVFN